MPIAQTKICRITYEVLTETFTYWVSRAVVGGLKMGDGFSLHLLFHQEDRLDLEDQ